MATAQTDSQRAPAPQPLGTAYLNEASNLMRSVLLPDTLAAYQAQLTSLDATEGDATGIPWLLLVVLVVALVVLGVAQRQIARRTHRVLNAGLLSATGVLALAIVWTTVAMVVHRGDLDGARSQGTARIEALGTAAESAIQAHSDEALMLIAHGGDNGAYAEDFTGQLLAASAELNHPVLSGGAAAAQVMDAAGQIATWWALDVDVREEIASGDYQAAVTATLGDGSPGGTSSVAARVGGDLNAAMTAAQAADLHRVLLGSAARAGRHEQSLPIAERPRRPEGVRGGRLHLDRHHRQSALAPDPGRRAGILTAQDPHTHIVGSSLEAEPYGIGIAPSHVDLVRFVNGVLAQLRADGSWSKLYRKWPGRLGGPVPAPPPAVYRG